MGKTIRLSWSLMIQWSLTATKKSKQKRHKKKQKKQKKKMKKENANRRKGGMMTFSLNNGHNGGLKK